jgi:hypothetical protein
MEKIMVYLLTLSSLFIYCITH